MCHVRTIIGTLPPTDKLCHTSANLSEIVVIHKWSLKNWERVANAFWNPP